MPWRFLGVKPFSMFDGAFFIFATGVLSGLLTYLTNHPNVLAGIVGFGSAALLWLRERVKNEHTSRLTENDTWRGFVLVQQQQQQTINQLHSRVDELEREKIRLERTCEQYATIIGDRQKADPSSKTTAFLPPIPTTRE